MTREVRLELQRRDHLAAQIAQDHLGHVHLLNATAIAEPARVKAALSGARSGRSVVGLSNVAA
jgi:hypothetical protein